MKTRSFNWCSPLSIVQYVLCIVLLGLSMSVTSCKDDDDDNKSEEQKAQEAQEAQQKADKFWDVVGQLTSTENYNVDYADKTFEPTIGEPQEGNAYVRIVATNDMATAAKRFANLVDVSSINENTSSYEWKDENVGTLTYTKTTDGSSWATVDVSIKQMPHLQKIIYQTPSQIGTNASFSGTAYYRFGDVVQRIYKGKEEYWVCVRPAFGPEGKGDSHWMTLSPLPENNIWDYTASTNATYALPTGIGTNKEHMQNFAEMIYAITNPTKWWTNLTANAKLKMFNDFSHANKDYHNQYFWERVSEAWTNNNVWKVVFGEDYDTADKVRQSVQDNGVNLLYKGYSWWTTTSWNLSLYEASFTNSENNNEQNLHHAEYNEVKANVRDIKNLNIRTQYQKGKLYYESAFFGNGPRFIVRYATGKELLGVKPNVYSSIESNEKQIKDFYTYNNHYQINPGQGVNPEVAERTKDPEVGNFIGDDGQIYATLADVAKANAQAVAVVLFYRSDSTYIEPLGRYDTKYHGLAMALDDMGEYAWASDAGDNHGLDKDCAVELNTTEVSIYSLFQVEEEKSGMSKTKRQVETGCNYAKHVHPAAKACWEKTDISQAQRTKYSISNWFLPSIGQWLLAVGRYTPFVGEFDESNPGDFYRNIKREFEKWGIGDKTPSGIYWLNTNQNDSLAYQIVIANDQKMRFLPALSPIIDEEDDEDTQRKAREDSIMVANLNKGCHKYMKKKVRPFIAFK